MALTETSFLLNERVVRTREAPGRLVLDYLRRTEFACGTKEGCKEGDCGACVVLVGDFEGERLRYRPVTACLLPLGELSGKHLVTIEGLNLPGGTLSPVQESIVNEGATQCGFCTPGIVVSMNGLLMDERRPCNADGVKYALSGHLCRCTGYRSLKASAPLLEQALGEALASDDRVTALINAGALPEYLRDIPQRLRALQDDLSGAAPESSTVSPPAAGNGTDSPGFFIAGGTDLYVQSGDEIPASLVEILNRHPEMRGIGEADGEIRIGALTTFEELGESPVIRKAIPEIEAYLFLIASWQIRNRSTVGGNLVNASPIGDITSLLLAFDTTVVLSGGGKPRSLPLREFYLGYKELAKEAGELVTGVRFPVPGPDTRIHWEKVSKRTGLDIASVNSGCVLEPAGDGIGSIGLSLGGVAPIPYFCSETSRFLTGRKVNVETLWEAHEIMQDEIDPISDVRGSADYKRLLARQFLFAHFNRFFPEIIHPEVLYEAH